MKVAFSHPGIVLAIPLMLSLVGCADERPIEDLDSAHALPQQGPGVSAPRKPAPTDIACTADADCAGLNTTCARSVCDAAVKKCTLEPTAAEGTACGAANLCDNVGRCLPCGAAPTSTYGLIQSTIYDSPVHGCNSQVCHGSSPGQALLDLRADVSYAQSIGAKSTLSDLVRIRPTLPDQSFIYRKMAWATTGAAVPGGSPMPAGGSPAVPLKLLQGMGDWIRAGASDKGFVPGTVAKLCEAPCVRNSECSNNNVCDGEETCQAGKCIAGTPLRCEDSDACTADRCDARTGCKSVRSPGLPCGEGGVCDEAGTCKTCASAPVASIDAGSELSCTLPPVVSGKLEQLWDFPLPMAVSSKPLVLKGVAYVTSWDGVVYALDAKTGKELWTLKTMARALHGGVIEAPDGTLLFGDAEAVIWRIDTTGKVLWKANLQETGADHVWSNVAVHDGIVFVPLASHTDVPCTKGRTVALELATGNKVWSRYNVPRGGVCRTDTAIECKTSADCPSNGACEDARGGAVTAGLTLDPDGKSLYVNTVGCYTFPQVGDTDAMMKLDAKTGETKWIKRFSADEQFNYCPSSGKDCRTAADCGAAGGACVPKANFHDFGFINAPLLVAAADGKGGKRKLLVNGNKSAGVYALDADTGDIVWLKQVLPSPTTPGFAGYGLFNGGFAYEDGKFFGALYETIPYPNPAPNHLMAFSEVDGSIVWSDDIGKSWSSLTTHAGVVYAGTMTANEFYTYNTKSGARLGTYAIPATTAGAPAVDGDVLYVGYGVGGVGGVRAYRIK